MKLIGYTCTFNEAGMVPYVMPYVERMGYDKFIVYDNMSTDNTVELLSNYPFVEIRYYDTNGKFDDNAKRQKEIDGYVECYKMAKVGTPEEEVIWMTFTDFDEVIFGGYGDGAIKEILNCSYIFEGYNCFFEQMVNLLPPKDEQGELYKRMEYENKPLVHTIDGVRGGWCYGNMAKPTMFCVNDFNYMAFVQGNHYAVCKTREGKKIRNLSENTGFTPFHLKFISKEKLKKKWANYDERGLTFYGKDLDKIETHYRDYLYPMSFSLENYFLNKGLKNIVRDTENTSGLKLVI